MLQSVYCHLSLLLLTVSLAVPFQAQSQQNLPNLKSGCSAIGDCGTNTHNRFNDGYLNRSKFNQAGGCQTRLRCQSGMKAVCNETYATRICIDEELAQDELGYPQGNFDYYKCNNYCKSRGLRLPTNNEWLVASLGTSKRSCLPDHGPRRPDWNSRREMTDQSFNRQGVRRNRNQCVSIYGVKDMVGVLGQWVTHGQARSNRAQFNGGLWPQPASNIFYRTTAHAPGYFDYSIGCRCASDAN